MRNVKSVTGAARKRLASPAEALLTGVSLVSIFGGVTLALWFMPSDVAAEGALAVSGMWICLGLMGAIGADVVALGLGSMLRAEHIVLAGIAYFLLIDLMEGLYPVTVSTDAVRSAFMAIGLFASGCSIARLIPRLQLPRTVRAWMTTEYSEGWLFRLTIAFFALGMFRFFFASEFSIRVMVDGLGESRFAAPWSRGRLGGWDALTDVLINFGYPLGAFTVMLALRRARWLTWKVGVGAVLSVVFLVFVSQGGARRIVGVIVGAGLFTWVLGNRKRLRFVHVLAGLMATIALLWAMQLMFDARNEGWAEYVYEAPGSAAVRVDDNFLRLAQTIEVVPQDHPYVGFRWIWYLLVRPIPRILWPEKPVDPGFSLSEYLGFEEVTLSTSVIGEWYVAFGWIGVVLGGLAFGVLGMIWSQVLEDAVTVKALGFYGFGAMALFLGIRSMLELILLCYPLTFWMLADRLANVKGQGRTASAIVRHPGMGV